MRSNELLLYAYGQIQQTLRRAVQGLTPDELAHRIEPGANTIGWLAWHLARVQDDHIADAADVEQVWTADGWAGRFGLPFPPAATGYGFSAEEVAQVRVPSADLLLEYAGAVHDRTAQFLRGLSDDDLDTIVDTRWDPEVTLGVRLISVLSDDLQHVGQAAFLRGLLPRG
ncbi:MAG TPA: DinB family protein [Blastococcus sp.]|nr:DinB family protein [Blastococcus sp.]